jgi:hypothetical protein
MEPRQGPSDRIEIRKRGKTRENKGKQGKDARRVASLSVNVQRVLSSSSFSTLQPSVHVHHSDILTRFLPVQHHPTSPARALTYPHLSPVSPGPSTPIPSHPIPSPIPSSRLTSFPSLLPLRPRHTYTDTDIRQRQRMARGTAHDAAARRKTWRQGRHGTRVDVDVSGARSECGR